MQSILFTAVFVILFGNVLSGEMIDKYFRSKCYRFTPFPTPACKRHCPRLYSYGHCERYNGKWQCLCKSSEQDTEEYTLEEANCIQRVANGEANPQCATDICPYSFQSRGEIREEEGEWKWYCNAREFGNERVNKYTLDEARSVYSACNGGSSKGMNGCREVCPDNYKMGDCFLDRHPLVLRCGCTVGNKLNDYYGVQEAKAIVGVCNNTVQDHRGCVDLCPNRFRIGRCLGTGDYRYCGCRQRINDDGWYTIPKAREMKKVCNGNRESHERCRGLCPVGYNSNARCFNTDGNLECQCMRNNNSVWITLKEAIQDFEVNNIRARQRARLLSQTA